MVNFILKKIEINCAESLLQVCRLSFLFFSLLIPFLTLDDDKPTGLQETIVLYSQSVNIQLKRPKRRALIYTRKYIGKLKIY